MDKWLDKLLGNKMEKEAMESQGTDKQDHFERKVLAHDWIKGVSDLDPVAIEAEYQAKLVEEARLLGKTAALDDVIADGTTPEEVVNRDYKRDVSSLSDYALAEMLAEARGHKAQNSSEMFYELKEKAKAEVASSREKAEKALLELIPDNSQLDWQKAFKEFTKDAVPAEAKEKDLFKSEVPEKEHDFQHPTEEKFKLPKDPEKALPGNGREADERKEVTQEAGVLKADIVEGTSKEAALKEAHCGSCPGDPGMEQPGAPVAKPVMDEKKADGPSASDNCPVCNQPGKDLGNGEKDNMSCEGCGLTYACASLAPKADMQMDLDDMEQKHNAPKSNLETDGIYSPEEIAETFINGNISDARKAIGNDIGLFVEVLELLGGSPEAASFKRLMGKHASREIKNAATKSQVIQKIAEVASPWAVTTDENGQEIIARVDAAAANEKVSEEDSNKELIKSAAPTATDKKEEEPKVEDAKPEAATPAPAPVAAPAAVVAPAAPVAAPAAAVVPPAPAASTGDTTSPTRTNTETGGSSPGGASTGGVGSGIGGAGTGGAATGGASTGGAGTVNVTLSGNSGTGSNSDGGKEAPVTINISNVGGTTDAGDVASGDGPGSAGEGGKGEGSGGGGGGASPDEPRNFSTSKKDEKKDESDSSMFDKDDDAEDKDKTPEAVPEAAPVDASLTPLNYAASWIRDLLK